MTSAVRSVLRDQRVEVGHPQICWCMHCLLTVRAQRTKTRCVATSSSMATVATRIKGVPSTTTRTKTPPLKQTCKLIDNIPLRVDDIWLRKLPVWVLAPEDPLLLWLVAVSNAPRSTKKTFNVDSPSFTPSGQQTAPAKKSTLSSQAASAAPFTPRGVGGELAQSSPGLCWN